MKKSDLQTGMRVVLRDGTQKIVVEIEKKLYLFEGVDVATLDGYTEDLVWNAPSYNLRKWDIIKIYNRPHNTIWFLAPSLLGELLWERKPVPEYTMEELTLKVGHEFKIKK